MPKNTHEKCLSLANLIPFITHGLYTGKYLLSFSCVSGLFTDILQYDIIKSKKLWK